jgi:hypothetical protein
MEVLEKTGFDPDHFPQVGRGDISAYEVKDDDRGVVAEFVFEPIMLTFQSKEAGREIWEDRVFIRINVKGNDKMEVFRQAGEHDLRRFPLQYRAFQEGQAQAKRGTPIERLPGVTPAMAKMLRNVHITTVEDLTEVADVNLPHLGIGGSELRRRAAEYLKNGLAANEEATRELQGLGKIVEDQRVAIEKANALIEAQAADMAAMRDQLVSLNQTPKGAIKKRRGQAKGLG